MQILFEQLQGTVKINGKSNNIVNGAIDIIIDERWQVMQLETTDDYLKIKNIILDQRPIDHLLYIMYDQNNKCTFGDIFPNSICSMPIHPNYAIFRSRVYQQLKHGWYGKQIYDAHEFVLDRAITFRTTQPKHIQDYFQLNTGPHWIKKWDEHSSWFFSDSMDLPALKDSVLNFPFPEEEPSDDTYSGWTMRNQTFENITQLESVGLASLAQIAQKANFVGKFSVSCNILKSGGHIGIHVDGNLLRPNRKKIYFNLDPSDDVYFKFASTGLVPMNHNKGIWLNTDGHVHSVVNDSKKDRWMVSIAGTAVWPKQADC